MGFRGLLCGLVLACLAYGCSDNNGFGQEGTDTEVVPPFSYFLYLKFTDEGMEPIPGTDQLLARRPEHLEYIYQQRNGAPDARQLFRWLEGQCQVAGATFAEVTALACELDLPIRCTPDWEFVDKVLGHSEGPGARHLRRALADAFTERARKRRMETGLVLAFANAVLARGQLKATVGKTTVSAETRAAAGTALPRASAAVEGRAAAVGAERLAASTGRLRAPVDVSAIQARLVQAEALETGARQTAVLADLARLRPLLERPPARMTAGEALWRDYVTYWDRRFEELSREGAGSPRPPSPLTWEGYRIFRTRFARAMAFQQSFSARLRREFDAPPDERQIVRELKRPRLDENMGLKPEGSDALTYVDQFVVDEATLGQDSPRVESFSTKQRDFTQMSADDIKKHVLADSREALGKYGGTVEVRRPSHPLFERQVTVSRVHLVYDEGLLPDLANVMEQMTEEASKQGVKEAGKNNLSPFHCGPNESGQQ